MSSSKSGRPSGGRNVRPTAKEVATYYELLRGAAQQGDINAAAKLIELSQQPRAAQ